MQTKYIILIFFILVFSACSKYKEYYMVDLQPKETLDMAELSWKIPVVDILVNVDEYNNMYNNYQEDIHISGTFVLFRKGKIVVDVKGVRLGIKGNKSAEFELKSLGVLFPEPIDNTASDLLNPVQILPFHSLGYIRSIRLRNSGNDFQHSRNATMIKDISYTRLAIEAGLNIDLMYAEQCLVFLNSDFLGVMNMRSESTAHGIAGLYKVDPAQVTLAKVSETSSGVIVEKQNGDYQRIENLLYAIDNKNIKYLKSHIDIANFIDYIIFQTFTANHDWPHSNVKFFALGNSKFSFFMYDLDNCNIRNLSHHPLQLIENSMKNPVKDLFLLLYKDEQFKAEFDNRYTELLQSGLLAPAAFENITFIYHKSIEAYMPFHIARYQHPQTLVEWYNNVDLLHAAFEKREQFVRREIIR